MDTRQGQRLELRERRLALHSIIVGVFVRVPCDKNRARGDEGYRGHDWQIRSWQYPNRQSHCSGQQNTVQWTKERDRVRYAQHDIYAQHDKGFGVGALRTRRDKTGNKQHDARAKGLERCDLEARRQVTKSMARAVDRQGHDHLRRACRWDERIGGTPALTPLKPLCLMKREPQDNWNAINTHTKLSSNKTKRHKRSKCLGHCTLATAPSKLASSSVLAARPSHAAQAQPIALAQFTRVSCVARPGERAMSPGARASLPLCGCRRLSHAGCFGRGRTSASDTDLKYTASGGASFSPSSKV